MADPTLDINLDADQGMLRFETNVSGEFGG